MMRILRIFSAGIFISISLLFSGEVFGQAKSVTFQQVKSTASAIEYEISWDGGEYKALYYEIKGILDNCPQVEKQVFLWKLEKISAFVDKEWSPEQLGALFEQNGFQANVLPPHQGSAVTDK